MATLSKEKIGIFLAVPNFSASGFGPVIDRTHGAVQAASTRQGEAHPAYHAHGIAGLRLAIDAYPARPSNRGTGS